MAVRVRPGVGFALKRDQFRGRGPGLSSSKVTSKPDRTSCPIFLDVGTINGSLQAFASCPHGPDRYSATADPDYTFGILNERTIPASRLQAPRPNEDPAFDNHRPNTDNPVWSGSGANAKDHAVANRAYDFSLVGTFTFQPSPHCVAFAVFGCTRTVQCLMNVPF
jgi:hypothetical protein